MRWQLWGLWPEWGCCWQERSEMCSTDTYPPVDSPFVKSFSESVRVRSTRGLVAAAGPGHFPIETHEMGAVLAEKCPGQPSRHTSAGSCRTLPGFTAAPRSALATAA